MRNQKNTSRNTTFPLLLMLLTFTIGMYSCSKEDLATASVQNVTERIDIVIESNTEKYIYRESLQSQTAIDLVSYRVNPIQATNNRMDFNLKIDEKTTLILKVRDNNIDNIWENTSSGYSLFPLQDVDDKWSYVTAEIRSEGETETTTYMNETFPKKTYVNVFKIVEFNPISNEILCRINDFPVLRSSNSNQLDFITGTFRGAVTFIK